jgi:DNA-binding transcriptional ArsR family regulator
VRRPAPGDKRESDTCELFCFNEDLVARLRAGMPDAAEVGNAEQFFSALGSRTRLLILYCLSQAKELCVCDIANALDVNLSTVSHQLRHLRHVGLVTYRSEGKMAFYRLAEERVRAALASALPAASATGRT